MLTSLEFKNWRSLRDVTIDFTTPITVLVGPNGSGKTNIMDALHFWRYAWTKTIDEAIFVWGGKDQILFSGSDEPTATIRAVVRQGMSKGEDHHMILAAPSVGSGIITFVGNAPATEQRITDYFSQRWQLLREGFLPMMRVSTDVFERMDLHMIDPFGANAVYMLDFMARKNAEVSKNLRDDLTSLLQNIDALETARTDRDLRLALKEHTFGGAESPTVSGGTRRIIAMLVAYHALDMRDRDQPGLVAIEEPDMGIHPLLLKRLVELFRSQVDRGVPRQFILTTHNPYLLDYFDPDEVRVVNRDDETGETWVETVPAHLRETWLEKHTLGEAWTRRLFGGVPE